MIFTALHRALGVAPGPLTDELLDAAVSSGVMETTDLDWKSELPPAKGLPQTDFPKDVAAMANSGGGVIVFGVASWKFGNSNKQYGQHKSNITNDFGEKEKQSTGISVGGVGQGVGM